MSLSISNSDSRPVASFINEAIVIKCRRKSCVLLFTQLFLCGTASVEPSCEHLMQKNSLRFGKFDFEFSS